ncbi:transposase [Nostoc sphaeroides CCNUC1]|uniref:Transposase n=1 Tax=Nostoc sphaeroides CCNUC1 TaxID=2653204 RepID=A0A5P8WH12_9NOSO|nr:transposase [Nostoc sphaeroides CCNUC1]
MKGLPSAAPSSPFCSNLNNDACFGVWQLVAIVLTDSLKKLLIETASQLFGAAKRKFMASTVQGLGLGGQRLAESELGWNRDTIRKGIRELESGITCVDNMSGKGRYKAEEHFPNLLEDIKNIVDSQSQIDPSFKSQRLYTRFSAAEVRKQLIEKYGYSDESLHTSETIRVKLNDLGYKLRRVKKVQPQKKFHKLMQSSSN